MRILSIKMNMKCPNCVHELIADEKGFFTCSECGFMNKKNTSKCDNLYAWLSVDPKTGYEGIIGIHTPHGMSLLTVSSDLSIMTKYSPDIIRMCKLNNMNAKLVHFSNRTVIDEINWVK